MRKKMIIAVCMGTALLMAAALFYIRMVGSRLFCSAGILTFQGCAFPGYKGAHIEWERKR